MEMFKWNTLQKFKCSKSRFFLISPQRMNMIAESMMFLKRLTSSLSSSIISPWFNLLKTNGRYNGLLNFQLKIFSWTCFEGSALKLIFRWYAQLLILARSSSSNIRESSRTIAPRKTAPNPNLTLRGKYPLGQLSGPLGKYNLQIVSDWTKDLQINYWYI